MKLNGGFSLYLSIFFFLGEGCGVGVKLIPISKERHLLGRAFLYREYCKPKVRVSVYTTSLRVSPYRRIYCNELQPSLIVQ